LRYFLMARGRFAKELRMADKRIPPEAAAGASRRKRVAPTIDLTATEVQPATAAGELPPHATAEPEQKAADHEAAPPDKGASAVDPGRWLKFAAPALAGGAAGAAITTLVLCGFWLTGLVSVHPAGSEIKSNEVLNARVAKIEDAIAKLPAGDVSVTERLAAADNAMRALGLALSALNRRSDDVAANATLARERAEAAEKAVTELRISVQDAIKNSSFGLSSAELDTLQKRIAGLEQSAKTTAADGPARLALSAAALREAAFIGAPLADALAQLKSLGADAKALAPLEPLAATGVPVPAALTEELRALLPAMLKLSGAQAPEGGFLDRLQANAGKLVRIRPVDAPPGDDASAVLARIEIAAAHADIGGALIDLGKLSDLQRAPAQAWIAKAQARQAALAAVQALTADTARALGPR
jgi:hypothetical protein